MLVSCLMVTLPGREGLARLAIGDFLRQDHPDRALIVVTTDAGSFDRLASGDDRRVRVFLHRDEPLGALRNFAVGMADGRVICQWDDDDRHHPGRVSAQLAALEATDRHSCFLVAQLYFFADARPPFLHVVDWRMAPTVGSGHLIPGTLLCVRTDLGYERDRRTGEDTAFLQREIKRHGRAAEVDRPGLYARGWRRADRTDGGNTTPHHRALANVRDRGWGRRQIEDRLDELHRDIAALALEPPPAQLRAARENVHATLAARDAFPLPG